jgi:hypothetical protein
MRPRLFLSLMMFLSLFFGILTPASPAVRPVSAAISSLHSFYFSGNRPESGFLLSYIEIPRTLALNTIKQVTLEAWVKRTNASRNETVVCNDHSFSYCLGFLGGQVFFTTNGGPSQILSTSTVGAGYWVHIAGTYANGVSQIYINGILDTSATNTWGIGPSVVGNLGIGVDLASDYQQNYFAGWIDNVRLWDIARNGSDIRATMFQELGSSSPHLLGEWQLNGDATDSAGSNDGTATGPHYVTDGAIPHDLRIPLVGTAPTLDGSCGASTEYNGAVQVTASSTYPPGTSVYLERTSTDLWVCFDELTPPTWTGDNWAAVYLDPNYSRDGLSQASDFSLEMHHDGSRRTRTGNGTGDYNTTSVYDSQWDGKYTSTYDGFVYHYFAEFRISNSLIGATTQSKTIGLAVAQHWIGGIGDDRFWPALAGYNSPATWSTAILAGTGPSRTFTGKVLYNPQGSLTTTGIPGITVQLIGSDPNTTEAIVATTKTLSDGTFSLTSSDDYPNHRLEIDPNTFPKGFTPYTASALSPGQHFSNTVLDYGTAGGGTYSSNIFTITDVRPGLVDQSNAPYFLIVAPQSIINIGALNDFVDYKRRVGFQVEVVSVETAISSFPGASTLEHIRNLEINRYFTYGPRFGYVMLVGSNATIPFGRIEAGAIKPNDCKLPDAGWPTDWFYADLTSIWDTNGNGCWGDGIFGDPSDQAKNGYIPDTLNVYHDTVAVGRLPFDDASVVHTVLQNSMAFERSALDIKRQALLSMSMMDLHGECYDKDKGQYNDCNSGTDGAYLSEALKNSIFTPNQIQANWLYENQPVQVGGVPTGASGLLTPKRDTYGNVQSALTSGYYGLVGLMGHGFAQGVVRTFWSGDANGNGLIDDPTAPFPPTNQPVNEIDQPVMFDSASASYRPGQPPVFLIAACSTGEFKDPDNLGAALLQFSEGTAWVGGTEVTPYQPGWQSPGQGGFQDITFNIAQRMITGNQRLGDAVWQTMNNFMVNAKLHPKQGWWAQDFDLYGDPTLSYWGNPGGQATLSPWPMLRQDAYGHGSTTLMGPGTPTTAWTYTALARVLDSLPPSPVVTNNGDAVIAHGNYVDVVRNGVQQKRLTLSAPDYGSPAIAADGTIYIMDRGGILYAFGCGSTSACNYSLHWSLDLTSRPLTSPVIGPDGLVAVAHEGADSSSSYIALVRSDGKFFRDKQIPGQAVGELAVGGDRNVYATTTTGTLVRYDYTCHILNCMITDGVTNGPAYTTPPLLYEDTIFAGKADGSVVRKNGATLATQYTFTANGGVISGPIAAPGGTIVVGTDGGTLYDLSLGLTERWHANLGAALASMPAASASDVYIASGNYLYAFEPYAGTVDWKTYLGPGANGGSVAVGYGRQVLVQTRNGPLVDIADDWNPPNPILQAIARLRYDPASGLNKRTMTLSWIAPFPAGTSGLSPTFTPLGYLIQRRAAGGPWEDLAFLPNGTTTYDDDSVQDGILYDYRIQVLDSQGKDSDFTTLAEPVQSLPTPPAAPVLNPVTPESATSLQLNWNVGAGGTPTSYRVERGPSSSGPFTPVVTLTVSTTSFTDTGLNPASGYDYRVIAINDAGESGPSNVQGGTTFGQTLPAPTNVGAVLLDPYTVQVSWDPGPTGASAVVEVNKLGQAGYQQVGTVNTGSNFTYTEINPNSYAYRVKFVKGTTESPYSPATLRVSTAGFILTPHSQFLPIIARK